MANNEKFVPNPKCPHRNVVVTKVRLLDSGNFVWTYTALVMCVECGLGSKLQFDVDTFEPQDFQWADDEVQTNTYLENNNG